MIEKQVNKFRDWIDGGLRRMCGGLSPERRLIFILAFCILLGGLSIYMTVGSIYNIGKGDAEKNYIQIKPINDSVNLLKQRKYER